MVGYVGETSHTFSAQGISLFLLATGRIQKGTKDSDQSERLSFIEHESICSNSPVLNGRLPF